MRYWLGLVKPKTLSDWYKILRPSLRPNERELWERVIDLEKRVHAHH